MMNRKPRRGPGDRRGPILGRRFHQAMVFAARQHAEQTRKKIGIPYIAHLMSVSALVLEAGGDEDLAIAGLLHDVVEDCGGKSMLKEVRRRFGRRVAHVVAGCTDADTYPKPPWRERKIEYLKHLRTADSDVRLVSAADKLHNARSILRDYQMCGESVWERFTGKREGTLWYYRAVAKELGLHTPNRISCELAMVVGELEERSRSALRTRIPGNHQRVRA